MSTQFYAPDQQATSRQVTSRQVTSQPPASQPPASTSWFRIWAVVIGTAVVAVLVVLALGLWHGQSSATPATGTSTSTSSPAQPSVAQIRRARGAWETRILRCKSGCCHADEFCSELA